MSILARFIIMIKEDLLFSIKKFRNPIKAYDYKIACMDKSIKKLKLNSAPILGSRKQLEFEMSQVEKTIKEDEEHIREALKSNDEELAEMILLRVDSNKSKLETLKGQHEVAVENSKKIKDSIENLNIQISEMKSKRDSYKARYESARATQTVNKLLAGLDSSSDVTEDDVEDLIKEEEKLAIGSQEIYALEKPEDNLDKRIQNLNKKSVKERLDAYRE